MGNLYLVSKSLHIISIVAWMAGVLYLYRLFVYHSQETEAVVKKRFEIMELRLFQYITRPAAVAALVFGFWMLYLAPDLLKAPWMHAKLLLVMGLLHYTFFAKRYMRQLAAGTCKTSTKTFRILNEVPTLLLILIVFLVVLKPF
ncbi:protoporphyrinogen oxidase HemJ [bacterium]|nr:protoporphyrinogen oxidase HemJ [bacterium]